jgi:hypothetical protein
MTTRRNPIGELFTLATADDLNGTVDGTQYLNLGGSAGCIIIQHNNGTAGTAGVDIIEFSRDGGTNWAAATAANIGQGHLGLLDEDGSAAAVAGAAMNAAGVEPVNMKVFSLGPVDGPFRIRCARGSAGAGGTAWVTGAPSVVALRLG